MGTTLRLDAIKRCLFRTRPTRTRIIEIFDPRNISVPFDLRGTLEIQRIEERTMV